MEMGTTHHQTRWGGRNRRVSGRMTLSLVKWFFAHLLGRVLISTNVPIVDKVLRRHQCQCRSICAGFVVYFGPSGSL